MTIRTVLFDADGVVQITSPTFIPRLRSVVGPQRCDVDDFITEIFTAEKPCLSGAADFLELLQEVLERWEVTRPVREVLRIWESIEPVTGIFDCLQALQREGVRCVLATNQQTYRAAYMKSGLGYDSLFDESFYSCEIGRVKPDASYFETVVQALDRPAAEMLFIDDAEANIAAARAAGMNVHLFNVRASREPGADLSLVLHEFGIRTG